MADLTEVEARELTDQIVAGLDSIVPLVTVAYQRGAWRALGYGSWQDYCVAEIRSLQVALPVGARRDAVAELADTGMSQRAIGAALGIDHKTAGADLRQRGENSPRETVTDTLGRQQQASKPARASEPTDSGVLGDAPEPTAERRAPAASPAAVATPPTAAAGERDEFAAPVDLDERMKEAA